MTFSISRLYTDLASELGSSGIELQDVFDDPMEEFKKVASSTTLEESIENLKQNLFKIIDSLNARKANTASRWNRLSTILNIIIPSLLFPLKM